MAISIFHEVNKKLKNQPFFGFQAFIFRLLLGGGQNYMTDPVIVDLVKNAKFYEIVIRGTKDTSRGYRQVLAVSVRHPYM